MFFFLHNFFNCIIKCAGKRKNEQVPHLQCTSSLAVCECVCVVFFLSLFYLILISISCYWWNRANDSENCTAHYRFLGHLHKNNQHELTQRMNQIKNTQNGIEPRINWVGSISRNAVCFQVCVRICVYFGSTIWHCTWKLIAIYLIASYRKNAAKNHVSNIVIVFCFFRFRS